MRYKPPKVWDGGGAMVSMGRNLPPIAAAGIEAGLPLFFSDEELNLEGEKKICPWNIPPAGNFSGNPLSYEKFELKKRRKKKGKENQPIIIFFYDWTTIIPQATVQTRCFLSISPLPARRKLHQGERGLLHLCSGIRRQKGPLLLSASGGWNRHPEGVGSSNHWWACQRSEGRRGWHWRNPWKKASESEPGTPAVEMLVTSFPQHRPHSDTAIILFLEGISLARFLQIKLISN